MVAQWIARLQPFDFAIIHRPGKHQSHTDGLSRRTSRPCKRGTCPTCKPLRMEAVSKTKTACCYTPAFPYQRHFDGYVEMSEEDAALFWEVGNDPAPDPECVSVGPTLPSRAAPITEAAPEKVIPIRPMPNCEPDDPRRTDACANPTDDSQETKPTQSARTARRQDRTGALSDDTSTPRPLYLQATIGTQTNQTNQT